MTVTYIQMHQIYKFSKHNSILWPVWLNGWLFNYKLIDREFEFSFCHLNFNYGF